MTENQIIDETLRYINDKSYQYAILIDGECLSNVMIYL